MSDKIYHPKHYECGHYQCIKFTRQMSFARGNAFKYIWRSGKKDDEVQDLRKAAYYVREMCAHPKENRLKTSIELPDGIESVCHGDINVQKMKAWWMRRLCAANWAIYEYEYLALELEHYARDLETQNQKNEAKND